MFVQAMRVGRAKHPELKLVACEGEGRGAVAVRRVAQELGKHMHAKLHDGLLRRVVRCVSFDGVQDRGQLISQEDRYNRRGRFVCAEPVIVASRRNAEPQQILIIVDGLNDRAQEEQELRVFIRRFARRQKVYACVGRNRPVVVLAGAIDAREGLFMQQAHETMPEGNFLHDLHRQLVVIGCDVGCCINRGQLMLRRGDFVVLGLGKDAKLPELLVEVLHEFRDPRLDGAEIVIIELLSLRGLRAKERPAAEDEVLALVKHLAVNKEVFLLGADGGS